jgi:catechol 2,3-dioxygenase-like lactoylglutathione lyase family enzyme
LVPAIAGTFVPPHRSFGNRHIEHADTDFYTRLLGMRVAYETLNRGSTQEELHGTFNAVVQITGSGPLGEGPGIEFLEYRVSPTGRLVLVDSQSNDLWHVHLETVVDDIDAVAQRPWAAGIPFVSPGIVDLRGGLQRQGADDPRSGRACSPAQAIGTTRGKAKMMYCSAAHQCSR